MMSARILVCLGLALSLSACGGVRESLGLGRNAPDEFAVVDRPPLSMPPDFALRPPQPGVPRPQEVDMTKRANETLFGSEPPATDVVAASSTEQALLEASGASKADPDIREIVNREAAEKVVASPHLVQRLLWWRNNDEKPAAMVDAPAEAARIKQAKDEGKPLNQGPTPVIQREKSGWLGL